MEECNRASEINYINKKWQSVVAEKDTALAEQRAENERLRALLEKK